MDLPRFQSLQTAPSLAPPCPCLAPPNHSPLSQVPIQFSLLDLQHALGYFHLAKPLAHQSCHWTPQPGLLQYLDSRGTLGDGYAYVGEGEGVPAPQAEF